MDWDYKQQFVCISMSVCIKAALVRIKYKSPKRPEAIPHEWTSPVYGQQQQVSPPPDRAPILPILPDSEVGKVQSYNGSLLFYD